MTQMYNERDEFRLFAGMLDGLAFLPPADVEAGMRWLRGEVPAGKRCHNNGFADNSPIPLF